MINMFKRALLALSLLLPAPALAGVPCTLPFTLVNGTIADATQVMANYNALVTCLAAAAAAGVNSDITVLSGLTTPLSPAEGGSSLFAGTTTTGSANAQILATATPNNFSFVNGYQVLFTAGFTNTGATTLNVNGTGAKNIFRRTPSGKEALTGGEIQSGSQYVVSYDGTQFEIQGPSAEQGGYGARSVVVSATTTDLGTAPTHNIVITGTTTITSFGTSASPTYPMYALTFNSAGLQITGGANLVLPTGAASITTLANDTAIVQVAPGGTVWYFMSYQRSSGLSVALPTAPTKQYLLSGTGATYTTPTGARSIHVLFCGGGGGGGAIATNSGVTGTTSTFNSVNAVGGTGGLVGTAGVAVGGAGGTGGTGTASQRWTGSTGGSGGGNISGFPAGASGAPGIFGTGAGLGGGVAATSGNGGNAPANTCAGGGGGGGAQNSPVGAGGGAGELVELLIPSPAGTYTYTIGPGGNGGAAGTRAGGNGGSGVAVVTEYYHHFLRCSAANDNEDIDACKAA